ncbi:MAG: murein L,D-transpeptidase catalytic domain family protein [Flavitalea sp.]
MKKSKKGLLKKFTYLLTASTALFFLVSGFAPAASGKVVKADTTIATVSVDSFSTIYESLDLDSLGLSREAFLYATRGYAELKSRGTITNTDILSIVDFSLPSAQKRLFIMNMRTGKLLFNTYVSHGKNSGEEVATRFSNDQNSFASSLGFYITGKTYKGEHGYSLRLEGLEKGINDNALSRGIVVHAANYVNEKMAMQRGMIGRSLGCPAVPVKLHRPIIQQIKEGSCLFVYGPDSSYLTHSMMGKGFRV